MFIAIFLSHSKPFHDHASIYPANPPAFSFNSCHYKLLISILMAFSAFFLPDYCFIYFHLSRHRKFLTARHGFHDFLLKGPTGFLSQPWFTAWFSRRNALFVCCDKIDDVESFKSGKFYFMKKGSACRCCLITACSALACPG